MNDLGKTLQEYARERAERISQNEADLVLTRAAASRAARRGPARHLLNAGTAAALALILVAAGIVVQLQLRTAPRAIVPATYRGGPLPAVPNEIVNLDDPSQGPDVMLPFRLEDGQLLPVRARWLVAPDLAIVIDSGGDCALTSIHLVDPTSLRDTRPPVWLKDCYGSPVILPGTSVLLAHGKVSNGRFQDLGIVVYDWAAGRVTRSYPSLSLGFIGGLVSPDATRLYALNPFADNPELDIADLGSGSRLAGIPIPLVQAGLNPGGIALSADGGTLYVNEGDKLATFDASSGSPGPVVDFKDPPSSGTSVLWPAIDAEAKEGFEPGHGIAVDPRGHWVAALGADDPETQGIWIFSVAGSQRQLRHLNVAPTSGPREVGFRGIAFSLDGSVLYALDTSDGLNVIDPRTGREIKHYETRSGSYGIVSVEAVN